MSSFIDPLVKYATPRSTRSAAAASRSPVKTDSRKAASATPVAAKSRKLQAQSSSVSRRSQRRTTRSQSREAEDNERAARNGKRKNTRLDLAPVGEESDNEDASDSSSDRAQKQLTTELEHDTIPESPNVHDVSGTTLLPTDSDGDGGEFDAVSMIESLPNLQAATARLLDFFSSSFSSPSRIAELAKRLSNPRSSQSKKLQYLSTTFKSQKEYFGSEAYIPVEKLSAAFPPVDHQSKRWRIDGILYKSNCALLALEILTINKFTADVEKSLYPLEGEFPSPFLNALVGDNIVTSAGSSALRRQTFDLALQVRTQFLKMRLLVEQDGKGHDPSNILHDVFFNENLETQAEADYPAQLRGFALSAFQDQDGNLPEQYVQDVQDRIREIRTCFTEDGEVNFSALEEKFSWEEFIFTVAKWLRSRTEEINLHLAQQPLVEEILDKLENAITQENHTEEIAAAQETQQGEEESASRAQTQKTNQQAKRELLPAAEIMERHESGGRKSFGDFKSLMAFHRVQRRLTSENRSIDFAPRLSQLAAKPTGRSSLPVTPASRQAPIDSGAIDDPFNANVAQASQQSIAQPAVQSAMGNQRLSLPSHRAMHERAVGHAFIDRQPTASRVSPINSQILDSGNVSSSRKRTRDVAMNDDEDGEFENDNRQIDVQDRRIQKPVQSTKRPRYDEIGSNERREESASVPPTPTARRRQNPASSQTREVERLETVRIPASSSAAAPAPSQSSPPRATQSRRPWTKEEDDRFIELVKEHGISWSKIKSEDESSTSPKLTIRKQVDLKDRARNLVMIMLKGGTPYDELPSNFDLVALKMADIENLRKRNIRIPERLQKRQTGYF